MQVEVQRVGAREDEKAIIKVADLTPEIKNAIELLEGNSNGIPVQKGDTTAFCKLGAIYYIESVDKRTYVYTKDDCYETRYRLYELENMLGVYFVRCSKSMIVNLRKVKSVKSDLGGRMETTLLNNEQIIISRSYVKEIKRRLEL